MTPGERLGFITRERFDSFNVDEKLGTIFDFLTAEKQEQRDRCGVCSDEFDRRYEPKRGARWKVCFLALIALGSAFGGFMAHVLGVETITVQK